MGVPLHHRSAHPISTHLSWPTAEMNRLANRSSSVQMFRNARTLFLERFRSHYADPTLIDHIVGYDPSISFFPFGLLQAWAPYTLIQRPYKALLDMAFGQTCSALSIRRHGERLAVRSAYARVHEHVLFSPWLVGWGDGGIAYLLVL